MNFEKYLTPVSIPEGYAYYLSNGKIFGEARLISDDWVAMPYENGHVNRDMSMTFRRLEAAETYLLALFYDKQ